jgi:hypothetical protein
MTPRGLPRAGGRSRAALAILVAVPFAGCREPPPPRGVAGSGTPAPSAPPSASSSSVAPPAAGGARQLFHEDAGEELPGAPVEVVARGASATSLRIDGGTVFWAAHDGIARVALASGAPALVARAPEIAELDLDATHFYWLRSRRGGRDGFEVRRAPRGGGASEQLARGVCAPRALALDEAHVYFAGECGGGVFRVAKRGGAVEKAAASCAGGEVKALLADTATARLYWLEANADGDAVCSAPRKGPSEQIPSGRWPAALAVQGEALYGSDGSCGSDCRPYEGTVWQRPRAGGERRVLAERQAYVPFLAASAAHIVWVTELGALRRARVGGGPITTLWRGRRPVALALDGGVIYWATEEGEVLRLAEAWGE